MLRRNEGTLGRSESSSQGSCCPRTSQMAVCLLEETPWPRFRALAVVTRPWECPPALLLARRSSGRSLQSLEFLECKWGADRPAPQDCPKDDVGGLWGSQAP